MQPNMSTCSISSRFPSSSTDPPSWIPWLGATNHICILWFSQNLMTLFLQACTSIKWLYANLLNSFSYFGCYYYYFIIRCLVEVWILPICQLNFSYFLNPTSRTYRTLTLSIEFFVNVLYIGLNIIFWIFWILLVIHISQFGITFSKYEKFI
jgi:hypothetical protein